MRTSPLYRPSQKRQVQMTAFSAGGGHTFHWLMKHRSLCLSQENHRQAAEVFFPIHHYLATRTLSRVFKMAVISLTNIEL